MAQWTDAGLSLGTTMPHENDRQGALDFENVQERHAHEHDPLKVRWQSGLGTKVQATPVCH